MLTPENESYIRANYRNDSVKKIAKKLGAPVEDVRKFVDSLSTDDRRRRERMFRVIVALFPVIILILLEIGLRVGGYGTDTRLFDETTINGRQYYEVNDNAGSRYFHTVQKEGGFSGDIFEKEKSPNTFRIFCLGESAMRGYPYMYNGAFPGMLKDRLRTVLPGKNIEMVNLGLTAISSFVVLDFTKQLLDYQPDMVLIYTGHNEFYGAFAVGSAEYLGRNRSVVNTYLFLERFKTFTLMRNVVTWAAGLVRGKEPMHGTLMQRMVRDKAISLNSDEYRTALENFRGNLREVIELCKERNVTVVVGTLASNLRGMAPFVSLFSPATSADRQAEWEKVYASAVQQHEAGDHNGALATLSRCFGIDSLPAKQYYLKAQCLEALGDSTSALGAYREARDRDGLPFRAPTSFNAMITDLCAAEGVQVAPSEEFVAARSAHGIIGPEMMLEHVHLNVDGYFTIAKAFYKTIADRRLIPPAGDWHPELDKADAEYRQMACVTEFDSVVAASRLQILLHSWPFTEGSITVDALQPHTELERRAKQYLAEDAGWEKAHVGVAEYYSAQKEFAKAAEEYRAIIKALPYNSSPYLRLAQLQIGMKDTVTAESTLVRSLSVEQTFFGYQLLGFISFNRGDYARAAEYLEGALKYAAGEPPESVQLARRAFNTARHRSGRS